jgi:multidrug efflux pump
MTTAAMVVGLVPLLTSADRPRRGRGERLVVGTAFTLFVLPAVYTVLAKDHSAPLALLSVEHTDAV